MKTTMLAAALTASMVMTAAANPRLETVARFDGPMPTGVAVSRHNRIFVNYPRWGDKVAFTVAELRDGKAVPYPSAALATLHPNDKANTLVSVQSVTVDSQDRLWILDTGSIQFKRPVSPKLWAVDLKTDRVVKRISFPSNVCLPTTYLNDVRFDLHHGRAGTAYITDSSNTGPNAIIVVDLATGQSRRRLNHHASVQSEKMLPEVEGKELMIHPSPHQRPAAATFGADGIALSPDGKWLYYCPLVGHHLYRVRTNALNGPEERAEAAVEDLGERDFASDGLLCDASGKLYLTDYEHNAVRCGSPKDGDYKVLATDPKMIWPDSMAIGGNGYLYVTCNQINRQALFHEGQDLRQHPYWLFRLKVDAKP